MNADHKITINCGGGCCLLVLLALLAAALGTVSMVHWLMAHVA